MPQLTRRQSQVADLLPEGLTNPEIAERLGISLQMAKFHMASVLTKLGAKNRTHAAVLAYKRRREADDLALLDGPAVEA